MSVKQKQFMQLPLEERIRIVNENKLKDEIKTISTDSENDYYSIRTESLLWELKVPEMKKYYKNLLAKEMIIEPLTKPSTKWEWFILLANTIFEEPNLEPQNNAQTKAKAIYDRKQKKINQSTHLPCPSPIDSTQPLESPLSFPGLQQVNSPRSRFRFDKQTPSHNDVTESMNSLRLMPNDSKEVQITKTYLSAVLTGFEKNQSQPSLTSINSPVAQETVLLKDSTEPESSLKVFLEALISQTDKNNEVLHTMLEYIVENCDDLVESDSLCSGGLVMNSIDCHCAYLLLKSLGNRLVEYLFSDSWMSLFYGYLQFSNIRHCRETVMKTNLLGVWFQPQSHRSFAFSDRDKLNTIRLRLESQWTSEYFTERFFRPDEPSFVAVVVFSKEELIRLSQKQEYDFYEYPNEWKIRSILLNGQELKSQSDRCKTISKGCFDYGWVKLYQVDHLEDGFQNSSQSVSNLSPSRSGENRLRFGAANHRNHRSFSCNPSNKSQSTKHHKNPSLEMQISVENKNRINEHFDGLVVAYRVTQKSQMPILDKLYHNSLAIEWVGNQKNIQNNIPEFFTEYFQAQTKIKQSKNNNPNRFSSFSGFENLPKSLSPPVSQDIHEFINQMTFDDCIRSLFSNLNDVNDSKWFSLCAVENNPNDCHRGKKRLVFNITWLKEHIFQLADRLDITYQLEANFESDVKKYFPTRYSSKNFNQSPKHQENQMDESEGHCEMVSENLNLKCFLTTESIDLPCKISSCRHERSFSYSNCVEWFLKSLKKTCPICKKELDDISVEFDLVYYVLLSFLKANSEKSISFIRSLYSDDFILNKHLNDDSEDDEEEFQWSKDFLLQVNQSLSNMGENLLFGSLLQSPSEATFITGNLSTPNTPWMYKEGVGSNLYLCIPIKHSSLLDEVHDVDGEDNVWNNDFIMLD